MIIFVNFLQNIESRIDILKKIEYNIIAETILTHERQ